MKNILLVVSLVTLSACAMEKENKQEQPEKKWSIEAYGTKINLHKGDMLDNYADGSKKVDFIVVGKSAQEGLGFCHINGTRLPVGCCWISDKTGFITKNENSDYECLNSIQKDGKLVLINVFPLQQDCNICIKIAEPGVDWNYKKNIHQYTYTIGRFQYLSDGRIQILGSLSRGISQDPVSSVLEHLAECYEKALAYIAEKNNKKLAKSIALPTLSVEKYMHGQFLKSKAAPVAVKSILEFIKNNPCAYDRIELFVEEDFEFDLYKDLLKNH